MKAKVNLSAKIDGIQYNVSPGETIPPALAEFYAANGATDGLIAAGAIEADVLPSESKQESKKGK